MYFDSGPQLLIYVKDERSIKKSKVFKAIEKGFVLFSRRYELVISTQTGSIVNGIGGSIVHTTIGVTS